jgi:hypothetical protein
MKFRHDATILVYRDLYSLLGSYELWHLKWDFDIACYYNLWLEPYMRDEHLDAAWLDMQLRQRPVVLGVLERFSALFQKVENPRAEDRFQHNSPLHRRSRALRRGPGSDASSRGATRVEDAFMTRSWRAVLGRAHARCRCALPSGKTSASIPGDRRHLLARRHVLLKLDSMNACPGRA